MAAQSFGVHDFERGDVRLAGGFAGSPGGSDGGLAGGGANELAQAKRLVSGESTPGRILAAIFTLSGQRIRELPLIKAIAT